jgi:hypothetical protein
VTATLETTVIPTTSNDTLAEAFAELSGLITAWAHLPAVSHGVFNVHRTRPRIALWFEESEHVAAWADAFGVQATESDSKHETETPFTVTAATLPDRYTAELELTHLRYHDKPAA